MPDIWTIAAAVIIAALAFWGWKILQNRIDALRYDEELANLEFESQVLSHSAGTHEVAEQPASGQQSSPLFPTDESPVPQSQPGSDGASGQPVLDSTQGATPLSPYRDAQLSADDQAASVIRKLKTIGLLETINGYIDLHGNTKGVAILQLRNRQTALLVPHMESEAFLRKNAKRADMIIMVGADGNAVVVRPLETLIADSIGL